MAMIGESIECMELLLKAGADPNDDSSGVTPLFYVVSEQNDVDMIRCLLNTGADPNKTTPVLQVEIHKLDVLGMPVEIQMLIYEGRILEDDTRSLRCYGVKADEQRLPVHLLENTE